ncbi:enoyl-CoA hydratase [Niveispirillum fermenti]|uniref:enoyl-CoA hydratase n=1 Tax=Niveispirillum fermenti TaxID=1233113 RepID=UPI003A86986E
METPQPAATPVYETAEPVLTRVDGAVAWITLNRPSFANAQNGQMTYALDDAFRRAVDDDAVRVIVLAGAGKHFCAGHDIGTPGRDADVTQDRRHLWYDHVGKPGAEWAYAREQELYLGMCRRWRDMPKPTIAMVQGACIAGGLALAWVCDLIVASEDAFFQDPVLRMGIPGIEYFAHAFEMAPRMAKEFLFLGDKLPARRAMEMGMVNRVVARDELEATVASIAERIAANPRLALALAKQAVNHVEELRGKRTAMDAVFHMHHFAHAQNNLLTDDRIGGVTHRDIARNNRS